MRLFRQTSACWQAQTLLLGIRCCIAQHVAEGCTEGHACICSTSTATIHHPSCLPPSPLAHKCGSSSVCPTSAAALPTGHLKSAPCPCLSSRLAPELPPTLQVWQLPPTLQVWQQQRQCAAAASVQQRLQTCLNIEHPSPCVYSLQCPCAQVWQQQRQCAAAASVQQRLQTCLNIEHPSPCVYSLQCPCAQVWQQQRQCAAVASVQQQPCVGQDAADAAAEEQQVLRYIRNTRLGEQKTMDS